MSRVQNLTHIVFNTKSRKMTIAKMSIASFGIYARK